MKVLTKLLLFMGNNGIIYELFSGTSIEDVRGVQQFTESASSTHFGGTLVS